MASTHALEAPPSYIPASRTPLAPRTRRLSAVPDLESWEAPAHGEPAVDTRQLDALSRTAAAGFAVDVKDRIVYWNEGAEKLTGRKASEVMGKSCFDVLGGKDPFGNAYCGMHCPIMSLSTAGVEPEPFCMEVKRRDPSRLKVRMRTVALPESGPKLTTLLHLVDPDDDQRLESLVKQLRATANGDAHSTAPSAVEAGRDNPLTTRKRQIVSLLSNGFQALNIAAKLDLSHATVRNHIQNILRKLEVHSQVEAIAVSFRAGWI